MANNSPANIARRHREIIELLAAHEDGRSFSEIRDRIGVSKRSLREDLKWLRETFPGQFQDGKAGGRHGTDRATYRWRGGVPHHLADPLTLVRDDELIALVAARGLLAGRDTTLTNPADSAAATDDAPADEGLGGTLDRLLRRMGVTDDAERIGKTLVSVSRFGAAPIVTAELTACLSAIATGACITFAYTNLDGETSNPVVSPRRLVLIRNEWYCVAWRERLRMYRLARMGGVTTTTATPPGLPASIPDYDIDRLLQGSFYATNGSKRQRVTLGVSPGALPFVAGRTWGDNTTLVPASELGEGWHRLSFVTTGLDECRFWVLGMGTGVIPEHPRELVEWIANESAEVHAQASARLAGPA